MVGTDHCKAGAAFRAYFERADVRSLATVHAFRGRVEGIVAIVFISGHVVIVTPSFLGGSRFRLRLFFRQLSLCRLFPSLGWGRDFTPIRVVQVIGVVLRVILAE